MWGSRGGLWEVDSGKRALADVKMASLLRSCAHSQVDLAQR